MQRELPLDARFTIEALNEQQGGVVELEAISSDDLLETSKYLVSSLARLGYESGDNASRILEGVTYSKDSGKVRELFVKLTQDNDGKVRVILRSGGI